MSKGYDDIHRYNAVGLPAGGIIDELARKPALSHVRNHAVRLLLELHPVALSLTHEDADRNEGVGQRHNPEDQGEHDEEALSGRYRGHVTKGCRPQGQKKVSTFSISSHYTADFFFLRMRASSGHGLHGPVQGARVLRRLWCRHQLDPVRAHLRVLGVC